MKLLHKFRILFTFLFILPQIITISLIYNNIYRSFSDKVINRHRTEMNDITENYLNIYRETTINTLQYLTSEYKYRNYEIDGILKLDYTNNVLPWETLIYFVDTEGKTISAHNKLKHLDLKHNDPILSQDVFWNQPHISLFQNKLVISAETSLFDKNNNFMGNLSMETPISFFLERFKNDANRRKIKLVLINNKRKAVLLNRTMNEPIEYTDYFDINKITTNLDNNFHYNIEGKRYTTSTTYIEDFDMHLISLVPINMIIKEVAPIMSVVLIILLILTVLYIILITIVSSKVINSIQSINRHLISINEGNLSPQNYLNTNDELSTINRNINNLSASLNKKIRLRQNIFNVISHNSASPITMLINMTQMLSITHPNEDIYKEIFNASEDIKGFIYNILTYISIDIGLEKKFRRLDLTNIIEDLLTMYQFRLKTKEVTLHSKLDKSYYIFGDYQIVRTIIENILDSILRYKHAGENFYIKIVSSNGKIVVKLSGVTQSNVELLSRSDEEIFNNSKNNYNHEAINLYIIKSLTHHLSGTVNTEKEDDTNNIILEFPEIKLED